MFLVARKLKMTVAKQVVMSFENSAASEAIITKKIFADTLHLPVGLGDCAWL